jgi:hypothetical protein
LQKSGLRFERTSMGLWRIALEKFPGMLSGFGVRSSFARACQRLVNKHNGFLLSINDERNRSAHGGPQSEKACEALINQFSQPLQQYLEGLGFLRNCRLIKVLHVHKNADKYLHRCTLYVGDAIVFPMTEIQLETSLDSEYLWFFSDTPVKLHPLMLVTSRERIGEDVWLYQSFDKETVVYKCYGTSQTTDYREYLLDIKRFLGE